MIIFNLFPSLANLTTADIILNQVCFCKNSKNKQR